MLLLNTKTFQLKTPKTLMIFEKGEDFGVFYKVKSTYET